MSGRCTECGDKDYDIDYLAGTIKNIMTANQVCFTCGFWLDIVENVLHGIRIDGVHHCDGGNKPNEKHTDRLGCCGDVKYIQMNDGKLITTNNLWHQGTIPKHFKDRLPDNAIFVEKNNAFEL